ncbi:MAG: hypothetical protein IPM29_20015 [Planctomycetes bacterium]|nr:hypothetical protein [Planctomycetota bacterium]
MKRTEASRRSTFLRVAVVAIALHVLPGSAPIRAQTVVTGGGTALNQAIQAARPGDHLIVRAGTYDPLRVDRGLRIDFDPLAIV